MLIVAACVDPIAPLNFGGRLVSLGIHGDTIVSIGDTIRLTAAGGLDGLIGLLSYDPLRDARWSSSNTGIATVTQPPPPADTLASAILVKGIRPGRVVIETSARGVRASHTVIVTRISPRPLVDASLGAARAHQ